MVDHNLTPELIHKLTSLDENSQNALTHYLLRSDERRRARVKEVYQVQPRFEQVATFDFKQLEGFREGFLVTNVVLSSSGMYAIITTNNYTQDVPIEAENGPWTTYLYVVDLANKGKIIHNESFYSDSRGTIMRLVISPQDNYYSIIVSHRLMCVLEVYDFSNFEKVKSIRSDRSELADFEPSTMIFSQDDRSLFFVESKGTKESTVMGVSTDSTNEFKDVIGYVPWYCQSLVQHPDYDYLVATGLLKLAIIDIQTGTVLKSFDLDRLHYGIVFLDPHDLCLIAVDSYRSFICRWDYLRQEPKRIEYEFCAWEDWRGKKERKYSTWYELPTAPLVVCGTLPYLVRTIYKDRAWKLTLHDIYTGSLESEIWVGPARAVDTVEHWFHIMGGREPGDLSELDDQGFCFGNGHSTVPAERIVLSISHGGTAVFFINDALQRAHLIEIQDFKVILHDLLAMIYSDHSNMPHR